jgi:predicted nucleotidyltransferase
MVTLSEIQQKKMDILRIAQSFGADNVRVFGSVVHGSANSSSDLDLLVRMSPERSLIDRIAMMQALEDMLHIKVDVVNEKALHPAIRQKILNEGILL